MLDTLEILEKEIITSAVTSFIDTKVDSLEELRPKLLYNDTKKGNTVLSALTNELRNCDHFWFSVAFITKSGIVILKETLKELNKRGVKGKILTTDYLTFNEPDALRELLSFDNLEVKVYTKEQFHTKGYMFCKDNQYTFIVGSSNLTQFALKANKEWNLRVSSLEKGELIKESNAEFSHMWRKAIHLTEKWIDEYEKEYIDKKNYIKANKVERLKTYKLEPNLMQREAIKALDRLREEGKEKALLISATGTGKTYLSAFDVRNVKPNKLLFLAHREQILKQAEESFKDVLGENIISGRLSGTKKAINADYLFSTVNMMAKDSVRQQFPDDYFDYIILDETHRAAADSYQKIINYFKPQFLLGMTATPERTDGYDIYQIFDHNIAYEIRLQQAMEEDLLCPFHYFGISELTIDGIEIDDTTEFKYLVSAERVNNIIEKARFYGHSGSRVKGLIFCSRKEEAKELSKLFNIRGFRTVALTGDDSDDVREDAINRLEQDRWEDGLDYIFSVDIFSEGVDIRSVNQIIMLRPTQSSIVFVQQLGRGLRKYEDKEYVVVIDFIGNYQKNFLIPIALSGDRSYNKDTIRRYVAEGNRVIPGCSTINFDEISRKRIYAAIDSANLSELKLLKEEYFNLKYKLGRIPSIEEFESFGSLDIIKIIDKCDSYYEFCVKYDKDYEVRLSDIEREVIRFLSQKLAKGKRIHELEVIKLLLSNRTNIISLFRAVMKENYDIETTEFEEISVINYLTNAFGKAEEQRKFSHCVFIEKTVDDYIIAKGFERLLQNPVFKEMVKEIVDFGISRYNKYYSNRYQDTNFELYQKYTYEDVCRILNWEKNLNAQNIGGYFYDKRTKTMPVFINYIKEEGSIAYEDRFISQGKLIALSKHPRKVNSADAQHIYNAKEEGNKIYLFVRKLKDDKEAKEFYFLGEIIATGKPHGIIMEATQDDAFEITYLLETPVREDIYEYITT